MYSNQHADSSDSFLTKDLLKIKKDFELLLAEFFYKNFSHVILHELAKFHYQTVFTSFSDCA